MEKIYSNKTVLYIIGIIIIVVILYFYNRNDFFNKSEHCAIIGGAYYKEELVNRNYTDKDSSSWVGNPQFSYSKKYNSCFYLNNRNFTSGGTIMNTEYYIINLTTNEKTASYTRWDKGYDDYLKNEVYIESRKQFDELSKEIF